LLGVLNVDTDDLTADELGDLEDLVAIDISSMISYAWIELAEHGEIK
jgi:hypothetical protein